MELKMNDLPEPIGSFILAQTDIKPFQEFDGAYYHYKDVCTLLNRQALRSQQLVEALEDVLRILDSPLDIQPNSPIHRWIRDRFNQYNSK